MKWTRPQWTHPTAPMAFDLAAYGLLILVILVAAGFSRILGW
jgi:hypothetical protein